MKDLFASSIKNVGTHKMSYSEYSFSLPNKIFAFSMPNSRGTSQRLFLGLGEIIMTGFQICFVLHSGFITDWFHRVKTIRSK